MVDVICPVCGEENTYTPDDLTLFGRVVCEHCHSILEVVAEAPLELEPIDEDLSDEDDEEFDDEYEDDEDI